MMLTPTESSNPVIRHVPYSGAALILAVAIAGFLHGLACPSNAAERAGPPNVVLILADDKCERMPY